MYQISNKTCSPLDLEIPKLKVLFEPFVRRKLIYLLSFLSNEPSNGSNGIIIYSSII